MSSRPQSDQQLRRCRRQQDALADLGRQSVGDVDVERFLGDVVATLAEAVASASAVGAFALGPDGEEAAYRRGVGWGEEGDPAPLPAGAGTLTGRALSSGEAVVAPIDAESPVPVPEGATGPADGNVLCVPVGTGDEPWGVLLAGASESAGFSAADRSFAATVGSLLSGAVERERTRRELAAERNLRDDIATACSTGVLVLDGDGEPRFANERAEELLGRSRDEISNLAYDDPDWEPVDADGEPISTAALPFERVAAGETIEGEEVGVRRPDGERVWLSVNGVSVDGPADADGVVLTMADVTERKRLHSEVEQVYGRISDAFFALDEEWNFTHVNERANELINPDDETLVGRYVWDQFPEAIGRKFKDQYERAMREQETVSFEEYYPEPLDAWFEVRAYPSETGLSVYFRDVTERKARERRVEKSERRYRTLAEYFPNGIVTLFDRDMEYTLAHGQAFADLPVDPADLEGSTVQEAWDPETADALEPAFRAALAGEERSVELAYAGREWVVRAVPITDDRGDVFAGMTIAQDITERRERERDLERYRAIVEAVNDGVYVVDEDGRFATVNETYAAMLGYEPDELVGRETTAVVDERVVERAERLQAATDAGRVEKPTIETELLTKDGEPVPAEATIASLPGEVHEQRYRVGVVRDITERRERERRIEESERRYRTLVENFPDGAVGLYDTDLEYTAVGGQLLDEIGVDPADRVGNAVLEIYPQELVDTVRPHFEAALAGEARTFTAEFHGRYLAAHTLPVEDADGDIFAGMIVVQDVTEREERQRRLREREAQLQRYGEYTDDVLDAVDDLFYVVDEHGNFQRWNESLTRVTGYTDAEIESMAPAEFVVPDDRETIVNGMAEVFRTGSTRVEARVVTADGEEVPMEFVASALENPDGERVLAGIGRDVTEAKARERELERRARQQRAIADLGEFALEADDLDELMRAASERVASVLDNEYCKVLDLDETRRELLLRQGVGWQEDIVGEAWVDADENSQAGYTLLSEEPVVVDDMAAETRFTGPDLLSTHGVESGISTIIGSVDEPWGILGTHDTERREFTREDLSFVQSVANVLAEAIERHQYQAELEDLVGDLRESNERLEQFAYAASHDLQEPLRMVSSYLRLLESRYGDQFDEDAEEFLAFAVDGADRMRGMIDGLLQYSRVDTRGDPFEPVALDDVVADVRENLQVRLEESDAEITVESLPRVEGDEGQLRQVFQNLLANAVEYSGEGSPRIHVSAEPAGDRVDPVSGPDRWQISVSDEGIGIDPDDADRVFEVFQRLHTNDQHEGGGIGLALVKRIIERHDGDVWVDSEPGEGATFSFTLPAVGDTDA